ncbi:hypothetical protein DM02DRAFT_486823, partial [Periconia macrospinosa]
MAPVSLQPTSTTFDATSVATAPNPQAAAASAFDGEDFANNLISDLAPLLTLFGEQVTKQFLSMSTGWADSILLGTGPLGIITAVVSAIRVGNVRKLKALIGRARESLATAEQELLTSTSDNVCELWSGQEIVRVIGPSNIKEFIFYTENEQDQQDAQIQVIPPYKAITDLSLLEEDRGQTKESIDQIVKDEDKRNLESLFQQAPNLSLNSGALPSKSEVWAWVMVGLLLQCAVLILPGIFTYNFKWPKGNDPVAQYAYMCFVVGSSAVSLGVALCGHVIDAATEERTFAPRSSDWGKVMAVYRLQLACTVGDQHYPTYLIPNPPKDRKLRTSRLNSKMSQLQSIKAMIAAFLAISGFILQFMGLRALHWSATIVQLGVMATMTAVRSWVRRGLGTPFKPTKLDSSNPDQIALTLGNFLLHQNSNIPEEFH